ncbi:MAG: flagellar basal body rod protein FlgC [Proteobacteria bacterium]|nr:flagellar basal body rod protein FlgC [Pseudomonadota bacterium]
MDFMQVMNISGSGMLAQSRRMQVAAENLANMDSVQSADGSGPYRAKQVYFTSVLNRATGGTEVQASVRADTATPLRSEYDPGNEMADARGFVQMPNVDMTIENLNMKEAQRSYEANLAAIETAKGMASRTLDLLR